MSSSLVAHWKCLWESVQERLTRQVSQHPCGPSYIWKCSWSQFAVASFPDAAQCEGNEQRLEKRLPKIRLLQTTEEFAMLRELIFWLIHSPSEIVHSSRLLLDGCVHSHRANECQLMWFLFHHGTHILCFSSTSLFPGPWIRIDVRDLVYILMSVISTRQTRIWCALLHAYIHAMHICMHSHIYTQIHTSIHPRIHTVHDVTWCDVTWCDVMWCDVIWCEVTWRDVMWHDVTWCDVMWHDMTWCDVMWCDVMRQMGTGKHIHT